MTDEQNPASTGPAFLVVDDDDNIRRLISHALDRLRPRILLEAADGVEAQEILRHRTVDVVITDMLMPNMDGRDLMRWAQDNCPEPLWIVLSGLDTFDAAVEALQLGAFDFLAKPLRISRLRVAARNALHQIALKNDRERLYRELEQSNARLSTRVDQLTTLCRMLEDQSSVIQEDLARAEVIQRALLPRKPPQLDGWCLETIYRPGRFVGGDLYDIIQLDKRHMGIVIADAAGHGVAAAMLSVLFKHRLAVWDRAAAAPIEPSEVLRRANADLYADASTPGAFITAAYLLIDRETGEARVAAAGHPPTLWVRGGDGRLLDRTGPALGLTGDALYSQETFTLEPGDRLLLYTDGLLDGGPASPSHRDLITALARPDRDRAELLREFHASATRDVRHDPDDITIILLERTQGRSQFDDTTGVATAQPLPAASEPVQMLHGATSNGGFISIAGTGTWMRSQPFFDAATTLSERHGRVTVDLENCDYLDSTFLGTLYELVVTHPDAISIQQVPPRLKALFDELSMDAVIRRMTPSPAALPSTMQPLASIDVDPEQQGLRLLKAHEILSSLSEENGEQFQDVVNSLRQDLDSISAPR